ncbi:hypothetical protein PC120_g23372 [Phytophthora cactorum]|nr:hypothetical protein PC120_g23372 [Phytophthora cactorum]
MQNSTMSDENFAAGLAWIACREGDDLELSQDDRAANARKTSPWTSYVEVQKSNSKHKAKAFASPVSEVPASLSVDVSELQQSLVPPNDQGFDHDLADDAESDAESMSTLVPPADPAAPVPAGDSAPMAEESSTIDDADLLQFFARVATASETSEASGFSTS